MKYKAGAQKVKPALLAPPNVFLQDVFTRSVMPDADNHDLIASNDPDKPISAGFYRLEAGKELVYSYTYNEMKIILEGSRESHSCGLSKGEFEITDETGYRVTAQPGDVFYFEKGCGVSFSVGARE